MHQIIEQYHIDEPSELNKIAIDSYMEERRKNPNENFNDDSKLMIQAKRHAIERFSIPPDDSFIMNVCTLFNTL